MRQFAGTDVSGLTRFAKQTHPLYAGIIGLIAIELTVVAMLVVSYSYLMLTAPEWPPAGLAPAPLLWPSVNLGLLLTSMVTMRWAGNRITAGDRRGLILGLLASVSLHALVLVFRALEMAAYEFRWDDHAYGSLMWTISGFHFTHVASAIVGTLVVAILAVKGYFTPERQLGVVVDTLYWNFVSAAWIPFYLALYWGPRLI
ncbi:cytochrome c oxidase subunit 3 [Salinarimonas rosea]|uniref:cytochrome c oxidase subunit 3 n=1 Tax=Salinarimonas rosea TaxID=552063 RepID=UPI0004104BE0|nr:cytochrome c oxidase subunit 3 [Salinarimonas rosea]